MSDSVEREVTENKLAPGEVAAINAPDLARTRNEAY